MRSAGLENTGAGGGDGVVSAGDEFSFCLTKSDLSDVEMFMPVINPVRYLFYLAVCYAIGHYLKMLPHLKFAPARRLYIRKSTLQIVNVLNVHTQCPAIIRAALYGKGFGKVFL